MLNLSIRDFQLANSGARLMRELRIDARHETAKFLQATFEAVIFYRQAQEMLEYLTELRSEQAAKVELLKTRLAEAEATLEGLPVVGWLGRNDERAAAEDVHNRFDFQLDRESVPLFELDQAIKALQAAEKPSCPAWLHEFLNS